MIAYVKGKLMYIKETTVIVDVGGIGYELHCPNPFYFQNLLQEEVLIHTYHHVSQDLQRLYGFKDEDEKYLFTKLISVSGIGPKSALGILSSADISTFVAAVENGDDKFLMSFPGVGKKTAQQIILDLKGKLDTQFSIAPTDPNQENNGNIIAFVEAKEALKALGYTERELTRIGATLRQSGLENTDEVIKKALQLLAEQK